VPCRSVNSSRKCCGCWRHKRSPDSYIAGGVAINRDGPRFSGDIDIFHDSEARLDSAVSADSVALAGAGYALTWPPQQRTGKREATVERHGEAMLLEWVADASLLTAAII
jgi:hypothetical protein